MKKFYFLAMMAMVALTTTSCQKDDFTDAAVQNTSYNTNSSTSETASFTFRVDINTLGGTQGEKMDLRSTTITALRTYFQELVGQDAIVSEAVETSLVITGNGNKTALMDKIKNAGTAGFDEALAKVVKLSQLSFTVYDDNNNTLVQHTYRLNYDNKVAGTWAGKLNGTTYTLNVSMEKPDANFAYDYKATLTVGGKIYEGVFSAYTGNVNFESNDKTLTFRGKFGADFKTFTVNVNNGTIGTATFSKK